MREFAPAKVNLCLDIVGRRSDGYHDLESLFVFVDVGDELEYRAASDFSLTIEGVYAENLSAGPGNLIFRAAQLLAQEAGVALNGDIRLTKNLPLASGIGGGSADAAAALRLLSRAWSLDVNLDDLARLGARLGADVPACVHSRPLWVTGIGDELRPVEIHEMGTLLLVNPGVQVSTAPIFQALEPSAFSPRRPFPAIIDTFRSLAEFVGTRHNTLTNSACQQAPSILTLIRVLEETHGCMLARMSGSGATCFGLYEHQSDAQLALNHVRQNWDQKGGEMTGLNRGADGNPSALWAITAGRFDHGL
ncbi:MAG: 4-(cytidine 5'-diphospho)-2-C-methyl-D-erythritol kinase [Pseudomonadota bacterium]